MMIFDVMAGGEMSRLSVSLHTQNVLVPTYNGKKGQRGKVSLVPVPTHVDQLVRRIQLSLKKARSLNVSSSSPYNHKYAVAPLEVGPEFALK
jgi:hypothetical protein